MQKTAQKTATEIWRQQVLEEHRLLNRTVAELRDFLERPRPKVGKEGSHTWAADLSKRLADLHDLLFRHFRFEERGGMMEEVVESHPRATGQVDNLLDEHTAILKESREIMAAALSYSEGNAGDERRLRRRLTALLDQLGEHERIENTLIMDLAYHDLGLGD
ncbi:MAG: hemerythrin domain-containing protein [Acidobacteriota bacterium]|nr:hemerythrin domain-containing protein [Acidobacteriota bacterium]